MEVGEDGDYIPIMSLHCHHQNDLCIKLDSMRSHFNVSSLVRAKVTIKTESTDHNF